MKLIIINGSSGIGKSTIAAALKHFLPHAVLLDVDGMRRQIPNYRERREESLRLVYEQTAAAVREQLSSGHDVIIDKAISSAKVLDSLIAVGKECGADVCEFLLVADKEILQARADARGYRPGSLLTRERVGEMWNQFDTLRTERPQAILIQTDSLGIDESMQKIRKVLGV